MKNCLLIFIVLFVIIKLGVGELVQNPANAPDLPGFIPNLKSIAAGSLIIPMDPSTQVLDPKSKLMSVLPYGLVIRTLWQNISVSWAIQTGKVSNGADFSAVTRRSNFGSISTSGNLSISTSWAGWSAASTTTYYGGPFIIPKKNVARAVQIWNDFKSDPNKYFLTVDSSVYDLVNVHIVQTTVVVDIRHTINTRPFIAVSNLNGNAPTQTAIMGCLYQNANRTCKRENGYGWGDLFGRGTAGCKAFEPQDHAGLDFGVHYATYDCGSQIEALTSNSCLTAFSEPHWEWIASKGPSYISAMKRFVYSGANFIAQCSSVTSYENSQSITGTGTFLSSFGTRAYNPVSGVNYDDATSQNTITNYPDLPVCQFVNPMSSAPTGNVPDFYNTFNANDSTPTGWNGNETTPLSETSYNNFNGKGFPLVTNVYDTRNVGDLQGRSLFVAAGAKYNADLLLGSNAFYLGGHSWAGVGSVGSENGRRFLFNAFIIPTARPASCGFTFCTPNDECDGYNYCTKCTCDPSGSGFIYERIDNCCVSNQNCTAPCTQCNLNTHSCERIPGCCTTDGSRNLTCGDCEECRQNAGGTTLIGTCEGLAGCCTTDVNCTANTPSRCVRCLNDSCVRVPAPGCCDSSSDCTDACTVCDLSTNQCVRQPYNECCVANSDCGGSNNTCLACNTRDNKCYSIPGCCNTPSDCGTLSPCVTCSDNACVRVTSCCEDSTQCGTCLECSNATNTCVASSDANCCVTDEDCGTCRRCVDGAAGAKTCLLINDCCLSSSDCEMCQNCSANHQCVPISECCLYDTDCDGCDQCRNYKCVHIPTFTCCFNDSDCYNTRDYYVDLYYNGEFTYNNNTYTNVSIPPCDLSCYFDRRRSNETGECQSICSVPVDWTGLIVGLSVGVPLGCLCLFAIAGGLLFFLLWNKDAVTGALLVKGGELGTNANINPAFVSPVTVGYSGL